LSGHERTHQSSVLQVRLRLNIREQADSVGEIDALPPGVCDKRLDARELSPLQICQQIGKQIGFAAESLIESTYA